MKKILILISAITCFSCSEKQEQPVGKAKLNFNVAMSVENFNARTKSTTAELVAATKCIDFYDYKNETIQNEIHQKSTDSGYGVISSELDYGNHDCYIVAHNSTTLTSYFDTHLFDFDKVTDTFIWHQSLTVDDTTLPTVNVSLSRAVGKIEIEATDAVPVNAASIRLTINGYSSKMIMETGVGESSLTTITRTFAYSEAQKGMKNTTYSVYSFIPGDAYKVNVTIEVLDANSDELNLITIDNAPIYLNKITHYSGKLFTKSIDGEFPINILTNWGETINYNY